MPLSVIDKILIIRAEEAMRDFNWKTRDAGDKRVATARCPVPGCPTRTHGGCCKRHYHLRHKFCLHAARR